MTRSKSFMLFIAAAAGCAGTTTSDAPAADAPTLLLDIRPAATSGIPAERLAAFGSDLTEETFVARLAPDADSLVRHARAIRIPVSLTDTIVVERVGDLSPWDLTHIRGPYRWVGSNPIAAGDSTRASIRIDPRGASGMIHRSGSDLLPLFEIEPLGYGLHRIARNDLDHPRLLAMAERVEQIRAEAAARPPSPVDFPDLNFPVTVPAPPLSPEAREWVGCYDLELGRWAPDLGRDSLTYALPPRIQFDSTAAGNDVFLANRWAARAAPGSPPVGNRTGSWIREPSGVVVASWGNGYWATGMRLTRPVDGTATGPVETFSDNVGPEMPATTVVATPVACDSPMPPEHRSWRTFPRVVHLEGGDSVTLGQPLQLPGDAWELRDRRVHIRSRPIGIFGGGTEVIVDQGVIETIEVRYPPDIDVLALVEELEGALGPAFFAQGSGWSWQGRESNGVWLRAWTTTSGEPRVEVRLSGG